MLKKLEKQNDQLSDLDWARQVLQDINGQNVCDVGLATVLCHNLINFGVSQSVRDTALRVLHKISNSQRYAKIIEINSARTKTNRETVTSEQQHDDRLLKLGVETTAWESGCFEIYNKRTT